MVVPQPVYANMAELRQMAALKEEAAGPQPDDAPSNALPTLDRWESDGSGSSGYGSVHGPAHAQSADALPPPPDFVLYNFCEEPAASQESRRPMSIAVPADASAPRHGGLRRSQSQLSRPPPPPPVRRESAAVDAAEPRSGAVSEAVRSLTEE
ncbi:uncharacterized protein LOC119098267 [Pollicipes pollicipes]|uniref:uncharacterized protein LOC119098267 n=1 Tax=Pollicipes pollicipes TaxID=41117 RepID=UPI001885292D|nr:uncharacterized protein LOC119098267 [Pollicipes pollicipes]